MQVRAQRAGFYGTDFKPAGAVFTVREGETATWFVPIAAQAVQEEADTAGKPRRKTPAKAGAGSQPASEAPAPDPAAPDSP